MAQAQAQTSNDVVEVVNPQGRGPVVLACEHASRFIPPELNDLGLAGDVLKSHAAWDPGARGVAQKMTSVLDAPLVASKISRLVYDCNRPPGVEAATPARSEVYEIPGNIGLTSEAKAERAALFYEPFRSALAEVLNARREATLVTVHSFTPVYHGQKRAVEIGILHDRDARLADAVLDIAAAHTRHNVVRNAPYGPGDGVMHTLQAHGLPAGRLNVMIEVRNDLIRTPEAQEEMGALLAEWIATAVSTATAQREAAP